MTRKRYSAEEIRAILKEAQSLIDEGHSVPEVVEVLGVRPQTFYRWRENLFKTRNSASAEPHFYGLYPAVVINVEDPEKEGRVQIEPHAVTVREEPDFESWARLALLSSEDGSGIFFQPAVGDEVILAFEEGDIRKPQVIGFVWNGQDIPPGSDPPSLQLQSRVGTKITFSDNDAQDSLVLETTGGQRVELHSADQAIHIHDANGSTIRLDSNGVHITTSLKATVNAAKVEISTGMLNVNAGLSKFNGVLQAESIITNSVVKCQSSRELEKIR